MSVAISSRDAELTNLMNSESHRQDIKEVDRERNAKQKWLNQLINIKIKDSAGNVPIGCEFKVQRRRMNLKAVQDLVNRCPIKMEVDYFYDSTGTAVWPTDMITRAQPDPEVYYIVPKVRRIPFDICTDPRYDGQKVFVMSRVPLRTKDEQSEVLADTLKEYLLYALMEVDPYSKPFYDRMAKIKEEIKAIDEKIKKVPKMEFKDQDGNELSQEEADVERENIFNAYSEERIACDKRYKRQENALAGHKQWRRNMGIQFERADIDKATETATWFVRFYGTKDAKEMEELLIKKDDWASIRIAQGSKIDDIPAWAGKSDVPDGTNPEFPDYRNLQVNISGVIIKRVPHGVGTWKSLDRSSSKYADDEFSFYYGQWYNGFKHGYGIEVDDSGIYSGEFFEGYRQGQCRRDFANGLTLTVEAVPQLQHRDRMRGVFRNPYLNGIPNGYAEILYPDGGMYRGNLENNEVTGKGYYQSGLGEIMKGTFKNGSLDGEVGYLKNHGGEQFFGNWRRGEMHGQGRYANERGDTYSGYWQNNMKHGRGREFYKGRGSYKGYFVTDFRSGKGELEYGMRKNSKKKTVFNEETKKYEKVDLTHAELMAQKKIPQFKNRYQGYLIANAVATGGIVMDTLVDESPRAVAKRDKRTLYPLISLISKVERSYKECKRNVEKFTDLELNIRQDIDKKKRRVFRQQKHYTKKAIYDDEIRAYKNARVKTRLKVRRDRLSKAIPDVVNSTKGRISHWTNIDLTSANHLTEVFNKIKIEKHKGEKKKPVKLIIPKLAISDFEEAAEKQRLIKYDFLWSKAETAYMEKKREAAQLAMANEK